MSTSSAKTVNRLLWTAQSLAAVLFLFAGSMKFIIPADKMQLGSVGLSIGFIHFIGICECLGALGLLLPSVLRIRTLLTPLAAAGLTIIMVGATTVSVLVMGGPAGIFPAVVGLVTLGIAYGRSQVVPIAEPRRQVLRSA